MKKIALHNPYLFAGHTKTAEIECTAKFIEAAKHLDIDVKVFSNPHEILHFDPDLVVNISFQTPKLTPYPTYVVQDVPVSMMQKVPRFIRNLLSYDGYLAISPTVKSWLKNLCLENNKNFHISDTAIFSVPKTDLRVCDYKNATAMYIGTNWDGLRHNTIFKLLEKGDYLKCHGPRDKWLNYPDTLYAGEIPFDGHSVLNAYTSYGAGLCIGHPLFDEENVPNSRIFEIVASSAVAICSDIDLYKDMYGDTVLYVNHRGSPNELADEITGSVTWIRNNAKIAGEMAKAAHDIFTKKFTMEVFIQNMLDMHEKVLEDNRYISSNACFNMGNVTSNTSSNLEDNVTYIVLAKHIDYTLYPILENIHNQSYKNINVLIATPDNLNESNKIKITEWIGDVSRITYLALGHSDDYKKIHEYLVRNNTTWVGILTCEERIFSNHTALLMDTYQKNKNDNDQPVAGLFTICAEHSDYFFLNDRMIDEHLTMNEDKLRMGYWNFGNDIPLGSMLFNYTLVGAELFDDDLINQTNPSAIIQRISVMGRCIKTCEVTYSTNVDKAMVNILSTAYKTLAQENDHLRNKLLEKEAQIEGIYASRSWTYTAPLRKMLSLLNK